MSSLLKSFQGNGGEDVESLLDFHLLSIDIDGEVLVIGKGEEKALILFFQLEASFIAKGEIRRDLLQIESRLALHAIDISFKDRDILIIDFRNKKVVFDIPVELQGDDVVCPYRIDASDTLMPVGSAFHLPVIDIDIILGIPVLDAEV